VVDAVVLAAPAPAAAEFAFDPDASQTHDERRPRKVRKGMRKPVAAGNRKWLAVAGIALLGLLAGVLIRESIKQPTPAGPAGTSGNSNPTTPEIPARAAPLKVLYVVPSKDLWMADYRPVRQRLESNGVTVVTASTRSGHAESTWVADRPTEYVPIDVVLAPDMDLSPYSAIVFCGKQSFEYTRTGPGTAAARAVIERMQKDGKVIAAICFGQAVLADHGYLKGRSAAFQMAVRDNCPNAGANWDYRRKVVTDGKLVTAAHSENADEFAETLLAVMREK
jgi:protease I